MGLFSKIKKGFKKIFKGIKKVIKKVVKGVKKVVKKISSSKILKALAIAAAVIVTGGAALTAFGSGTVGTGTFGQWMMKVSSKALSGSVFAGTKAPLLSKIGNFAIKTAAKPFGAVGGALGSTARVGLNIVTGAEGGAFAPGTATAAPTPFSSAALSGQLNTDNVYYDSNTDLYIDKFTGKTLTDKEVERLPLAFTNTPNTLNAEQEIVKPENTSKSGFRQAVGRVGETVAGSVLSGAAAQYIAGDPEQQGSMSGAAYEGAEYMDPLKVYAAQQGINTDDIYSHMMYGNQDPSTQYGNQLYQQQTFGVA